MEKKDNLKFLKIEAGSFKTRISKRFENRKPYKPANPNIVLSFISGTVLDILVKVGQRVEKGEDLMILDAMKMQNKLKSSVKGKIKSVFVNKGDKVSKGAVLLELE